MVESLVGGFAGGDGDGNAGCAHRNRCLRAKAALAGSVKFPANEAFAARAAITAAVVWVWWEWWWWGRWWWRRCREESSLDARFVW